MSTQKRDALLLLKTALGDESAQFRDGQWEAIDKLVNHQSQLLVVERTGWGKSSVYFIATKILRDRGHGPTLIVSPLLALMRNQIDSASRLGVSAASINSSNTKDWDRVIGEVLSGDVDALLISPERFSNDRFVEHVLEPISQHIGLMVVDEAHCISDWGHDFRPDYRRLTNILQRLPSNLPVLGTTATANNRVINDVQQQLGNIEVQRGPLTRESLCLMTLFMPTQAERLAWLAENVPTFSGTGIVYTLTQRDAEQVACWLVSNGIEARAYHSKVISDGFLDSNEYRQHLEDQLLENKIKVLVATSALGMGYDKPDLGFVIHYQAPGSIVDYYQQVGRAGRQLSKAIGVLMSGAEDDEIISYFRATAFPKSEWVYQILNLLDDSDGLTEREIEEVVNLRNGQIKHVLKFLSVENPSPVLKDGSKWLRTPVNYSMDLEKINRLSNQRQTEWLEVQRYLSEPRCLMEFLSNSLDDPKSRSCGKCANCAAEPIAPSTVSQSITISAQLFLKQSEFELVCNKQVAKGAFPVYGLVGNIPENLRAETGRVLSKWGDAGWGRTVAHDKASGYFRDELVTAVSAMITERWKPDPSPEWITAIPSLRSPNLVSDFCERLSRELGIPFLPVVTKIVDNPPQKQQQNRFHQCNNLDGVFNLESECPTSPVLLVDDIVDSAWTLTIVATLLRRQGSGPVFPLALTSSSAGG